MEEKSVEGRKSGSSLVRRNINGRGGANLTDTPLEKLNIYYRGLLPYATFGTWKKLH